jgi:hypothetical protein
VRDHFYRVTTGLHHGCDLPLQSDEFDAADVTDGLKAALQAMKFESPISQKTIHSDLSELVIHISLNHLYKSHPLVFFFGHSSAFPCRSSALHATHPDGMHLAPSRLRSVAIAGIFVNFGRSITALAA